MKDSAFAAILEAAGGFETAPRVAVGVSGGADSMALTLLLEAWLRARDGRLYAFTVDHGLRRGSNEEAALVSQRLRARGVQHEVLMWRGASGGAGEVDHRGGNLQKLAREARYNLLEDACRERGILHLALAHHRDDQAETLMLRLARGSGLDGLAAMPSVTNTPDLRILRPLLDVPKAALEATCRERKVDWIEDPSNASDAFARVRMRGALRALAGEGLSAERLAATALHLGRARQALEQQVDICLARSASLHPAGFLWLEPEPLRAAPAEVGLRALSRLLRTAGGSDYGPRFENLERLYGELLKGLSRSRTLGGCRILPRRARVLVVREPGAAESCPAQSGTSLLWDGRFAVSLDDDVPQGARMAPLGEDGWKQALELDPAMADLAIPAPARAGLPGLFLESRLLDVGLPGYREGGKRRESLVFCRLRPKVPLCPQTFTVAFRSGHIISDA
jgi:tRNA(Ile)-lysidine synthase